MDKKKRRKNSVDSSTERKFKMMKMKKENKMKNIKLARKSRFVLRILIYIWFDHPRHTINIKIY